MSWIKIQIVTIFHSSYPAVFCYSCPAIYILLFLFCYLYSAIPVLLSVFCFSYSAIPVLLSVFCYSYSASCILLFLSCYLYSTIPILLAVLYYSCQLLVCYCFYSAVCILSFLFCFLHSSFLSFNSCSAIAVLYLFLLFLFCYVYFTILFYTSWISKWLPDILQPLTGMLLRLTCNCNVVVFLTKMVRGDHLDGRNKWQYVDLFGKKHHRITCSYSQI